MKCEICFSHKTTKHVTKDDVPLYFCNKHADMLVDLLAEKEIVVSMRNEIPVSRKDLADEITSMCVIDAERNKRC